MKAVTLIASHTIDHICDLDNNTSYQRPGGPALYCRKAIESKGLRVQLVCAHAPTHVQIVVRGGRETIRIDRIPRITLGHLRVARNVLLSPILDEFDLNQLARKNCRIFMDAQGYIRDTGLSKSKVWDCDTQLLRNVAAVKVNEQEAHFLSPALREFFYQRILLITKGEQGVEVWERGQKFYCPATPVNAVNTIGAGDTFLGFFIAMYLQRENVEYSVESAIESTSWQVPISLDTFV